jgi:proton-coupled amino acid transporter
MMLFNYLITLLQPSSTMAEEEIHRRAKVTQLDDGIELTSLEELSSDADTQELNPLVHSSPSKAAAPLSIDDGHGGAHPGSANTGQVVINIIISFVGAGLLGIPNAFSQSGWLLGGVTLLAVSALNVYAMLCLPAVQQALLEKQRPSSTTLLGTYGEVGRAILGPKGEALVHVCLGISQAGFATAYIIFIAANLNSIARVPRFLVCSACIPGLFMLVQFRDLRSLSPFSLVANTANFAALSAVLLQDYESYEPHNDTIHPIQWNGLLYVTAITIYSMEGVGMVLSLKSSSQQPAQFSWLLCVVLAIISLFMVAFGTAGYWAFGNDTLAPITLNLTSHWSSTFVKLALCLGLYLTYPIMMFPLWSIFEGWNPRFGEHTPTRVLMRGSVVVTTAIVAYCVPNFGKFLSLVGSSICTLLGLILPCYFHLSVLSKELPWWQWILDVVLIVGGSLFGLMGTYQSILAMLQGELEGEV